MAVQTLDCSAGRTRTDPLITFETVPAETPANAATSLIFATEVGTAE
jgi:hypothetical protein